MRTTDTRMAGAAGLVLVAVDRADEAAIRQWYELRRAVVRADQPDDPPPCWDRELGRLRYPLPGVAELVWLARLAVGGPVIGAALLHLPTLDNLSTAVGEILVAPEYRRRGVGRALLAHLRAEALKVGRVRLIAEVGQPLDPAAPDPGGRFATACGATRALLEISRRLDLDTVDQAALDSSYDQARARARDYELVRWVGRTPSRWLDDVAYLIGRISTDAPLGELQWEAEAYDAARVVAQETALLAQRRQLVSTGAVDAAGTMIAYTRIITPATPAWYGEQWETIVVPEHRGHRLGMLVKVANLAQARAHRPQLRIIDTENADDNPHIVAINDALGFRPHRGLGEWQLEC